MLLNQTGVLESICKKILDLDPKIRFAGIISYKGKLLAGGEKEGVKMLVDKKNHEILFMEVALRVRMRQEFDKQLGPVNFTVSHRRKMVIMSFPFRNEILYVSGENDLDLAKVPSEILRIIKDECN
jgi:uncharacterized protein DUF6659